MVTLICAVLFLAVSTIQAQISISGTVTNTDGEPIAGASVSVPELESFVYTNDEGEYEITISPLSVQRSNPIKGQNVRLQNGRVMLSMDKSASVRVEVFSLNGRLERLLVDSDLAAGDHSFPVDPFSASTIRLVRATVGQSVYTARVNSLQQTAQLKPIGITDAPNRSAAISGNVMRVSRAGYRSEHVELSDDASQIVDVALERLPQGDESLGTSPVEDGSGERIERYGVEQIYWGELNGELVPLVKIVTAVTEQAVDINVIFNPHFTDNTYGTGSVGWGRNRPFHNVVTSNHVRLAATNNDGDTAFYGELDQIHKKGVNNESGYAALGPFGGDGDLIIGDPDHILSYGTSTCDNINYHGYHLFENSPQTDESFTPNPDYPNWEYLVVYRLSLDPEAFGESGFRDVQMTHVHSSPAKGDDTIGIEERDDLEYVPGSDDDPFRYLLPVNPHVPSDDDDDSSDDGDDSGDPSDGDDDEDDDDKDDDPIDFDPVH
ncbi:hypothetical protein QA601_12630 [Chitinispirillales bacterium ANBcel5]|uniref:carboxypeptidase regulatory-like domain-containing protein n=1 Tax=Cellulosispirillum alkaliphilum TaxID=3039283 RepID=UPI002A56AED0|nr:hypothetical protein [Chitinispirillales bacterium ANBcel5]